MMGKTYKIKQTSKQINGKFFYTSGYFMKKLAFYVVDRFEKQLFQYNYLEIQKLHVCTTNFRKNTRFWCKKNLFDHVFW